MRTNNLLTSTALTTSAMLASSGALAQSGTVYNWTGWYVGLNIGGSSSKIEQEVIVPGLFIFPSSGRDGGFTGGIQGGYNWQFAPFWVAGVEVDSSYLRGERTSLLSAIDVGTGAGEDLVGTQRSKLRWLTTIRGRFGPTLGRTFLYGTAGLAIGKEDSSVVATVTVNGGGPGADTTQYAGSSSSIRTGWTAGGGIEHAFTDRVSARVEYLHFDLGTISYNVLGTITVGTGNDAPLQWPASASFSGDIVRFGLNVKLGP
jgi:outer membrane immunogenic protein